jgi:DNA-directed RNA polymerase specialized sigma24 family protein
MGDKYREVFVLHEVMGFTPAEIAAIIDVPINTVRSRLGTARMQFHEACNRLGVNRG